MALFGVMKKRRQVADGRRGLSRRDSGEHQSSRFESSGLKPRLK
jgi:hypothetical protein